MRHVAAFAYRAAACVASVVCCLLVVPQAAGQPAGGRFSWPPQASNSPVEGFSAYGGKWTVKNGVLVGQGDGGSKLVFDQPLAPDAEVTAEIFLAPNIVWSGLLVGVSEPGVGADRFFGYEVSVCTSRKEVRLGAHRNNFALIRDVPCAAVQAGQWAELAVRRTGRRIEVRFNGQLVVSHDDGERALPPGRAGFRVWNGGLQCRNFRITSGGTTKRIDFVSPYSDDDRQVGEWPESLSTSRLPPILFLMRHMLSQPPVVGCDLWAARPTKPGAAISVWDPTRPGEPPRTIFHDTEGCIYDINLSLDARTVFFSYARQGEKHWHLWRVGVDGSDLKQITDGPYYDVGPCELPDGDLMFVSTRRFGHTVCQPGPASNVYRVSRDGGRPQCLSMNSLSDTTPQLLPDGRVLFMRWEYVDRDLTFRQSLWTQNPDGTGYQLYFGNTLRDPGTLWQARPIPGHADRVLATFAPHHGYPHGAIGWIERDHGPETPRGVGFGWITGEFPNIADHAFVWAYRDPYPLDEATFLCSYSGTAQKFRLFLHDTQDRKRLLYEHPERHCFFPIPLRPVPRPPLVPRRAQEPDPAAPDLPEEHPVDAQPMGTCVLADVYQGLGPAIARGRVKSLRIMEQIRKTEDIPVTPHTVDFGPRSYDQSPLMSYATYYAKRCWGSVPVEEDGSAHFDVPALREIYFQACDAEGRELQRMTSGVQVMPGERVSCIGCHESRTWAPPARGSMPLAARRPPSVPKKPAWAPDGIIDFVTVVQPVLDKHCVRCHGGARVDGGYDLSGDKTRLFNMAYDNLLGRSRSYRQHNMDTGEMLPEEAAKGKPLVHFYWLLRTPTAVNQPLWTGSHASRLTDLIVAKHGDVDMPPEDRERIYTWIDANVPYYGTFATSRPKCGGKRDLCQNPETAQLEPWFTNGFMPVYARRCASCHGEFQPPGLITCWDGRTAWINLTRPQFSPALTAHLPKALGGRGIDKTPDGQPVPMFAGSDDPDYRTMLGAIQEGKRLAEAHPGPDMPGFRFARREP